MHIFTRIRYLIGITFFIAFLSLFSLYKPVSTANASICSLSGLIQAAMCNASIIGKTCNEGSAGTCGGYCSGNSNACCTNGNSSAGTWSKTTYQCIQADQYSCYGAWVPSGNSCSTGDKCLDTSQPYLNAGDCNCGLGGRYKTCCNGTSLGTCYQLTGDGLYPPEGACNGGTTVSCSWNGSWSPTCGQAACNTLCTPVNGGWSGWGACSLSCGTGTQTRTCNNPAPNSCGAGCSGPSSQSCTVTAPVDGGWSGWSGWSDSTGYSDGGGGTCSKSCGTGTQTRTRACNNPTPNSCGAGCSGSTSEAQNCNTQSCSYNAKAHVYTDYNGNGLQDAGEPDYQGTNDITYYGAISGTNSTAANGIYEITSIPPGSNNEIIRVNAPSSTWKITTANDVPISGPQASEQTVNFGIQPPPPICDSLNVNTPIFLGGQSNLQTVNCRAGGGTGTALNYEWFIAPDGLNSPQAPAGNFGNLSLVTPPAILSSTNTFNAAALGTDYYPYVVDASVSVCNPGTTTGTSAPQSVCTTVGNKITVNPKYSIKGFIFVDTNKNSVFNPGEPNYTGAPALQVTIGANTFPATNGNFDSGISLIAGTYLVTLTTMPTNPDGSPDKTWSPTTLKQYSVTVGHNPPCSTPIGTCDANGNGNVSGIAFGITNMNKWLQTIGGDVYIAGGIDYRVPKTVPLECTDPTDPTHTNGYMSISQPSTIQMPGIMLTGNGTANFTPGSASLKNWIVNDTIDLPLSTSYAAVKKSITDRHITPKASPCGDINNCSLPSALPSGVYEIDGATVKLTGVGTNNGKANTLVSNADYTFLIPGDLNIITEIHVPIGATATFIVQGNITVDKSIGTGKGNYKVTTTNIDGYFSAGGNFTVDGINDCLNPNGPDQRLNMSGAIVVNTSGAGGSFSASSRDMCDGDVCPTFSIAARPDFVLNIPSYLLSPTILWQEIAP